MDMAYGPYFMVPSVPKGTEQLRSTSLFCPLSIDMLAGRLSINVTVADSACTQSFQQSLIKECVVYYIIFVYIHMERERECVCVCVCVRVLLEEYTINHNFKPGII